MSDPKEILRYFPLFFGLALFALLSWPSLGLLVVTTHFKTAKMEKTQERVYLNIGPKNVPATYYKRSGSGLARDLGNVIYVSPGKAK